MNNAPVLPSLQSPSFPPMPPPLLNSSITYRLAYTGEFFPFLFRQSMTGKKEGIYLEVWKILSERMGVQFESSLYEYGEWRGREGEGREAERTTLLEGSLEGALTNIQRGQLLAQIDGMFFYNSQMAFIFRYSGSFYYATKGLYEARRSFHHSTSLSSFLVFDDVILVLFIGLLAVALAVETLGNVFRIRFGIPRMSHLIFVPGSCYLMSLFFIHAVHTSGFHGNNIVTSAKKTTFWNLTEGLRGGQRQFIVQPELANSAEHDYFLSGRSKPPIISGSTVERLEEVCRDEYLVTRLHTIDTAALSAVRGKGECLLERIRVDQTAPGIKQFKYTQEFDDERPYMIILNREMASRRFTEYLDQILLRLFREEQMNAIWTPRFSKTYARINYDRKEKGFEYSIVNLSTLSSALAVTVYLSCAVLAVFALECLSSLRPLGSLRRGLRKTTEAMNNLHFIHHSRTGNHFQ